MRAFLSAIMIAAFLLTAAVIPVLAGPSGIGVLQPTAYQTSTPQADGRILYLVQEGDTLWKISAITGVPIDELERLNNIRREDPLQIGTTLLLGIVTPTVSEPTLAFLPSATPSPLPVKGKGTICVSFFNDANGDGTQQEGEGLVAGGQISVALSDGTSVGNHTLDDPSQEFCFADIPSGQYNVAAAAPKDFNPTAEMNKSLELEPGVTAKISFPVQSNQSAPADSDGGGGGGGGSSLWLGLIGLAFLGGAGLMVYNMMKPRRLSRW